MSSKKLNTVVAMLFVTAALNVGSGVTEDAPEPQPQPQSGAQVVFNATVSTADRQVKLIYTRIHDSISFRWNSNLNKSIDYCRWDRAIPFDHHPLSIVSTAPSATNGYLMDVAGLHEGFCQLTISDVQEIDLTLWNCTVIDKEMRHDGPAVSMGTIKLAALVKPSSPELIRLEKLVDRNRTDVKNTVNITCCASGGRPSPKLTITLDNDVLNETPNYDHPNNSEPTGDQFCFEIVNFHFNWTLNRKRLNCTAHHPSYTDTDATQDGFALNIYHEPKILSSLTDGNEITFTIDKSESTERVYVEFVGNPLPIAHWLMKSSSGSFENLPIDMGHIVVHNIEKNTWEAELTKPSEAAKHKAQFLLVIKNRHGEKEVRVNIQLRPGARWGWIVIYVVGALASIIMIIFLISLLLKRKGWLCYDDDRDFKRNVVYGSPEEIDDSNLPIGDEYEMNPTLARTKEPVRTREGTVYVAPSTSM